MWRVKIGAPSLEEEIPGFPLLRERRYFELVLSDPCQEIFIFPLPLWEGIEGRVL